MALIDEIDFDFESSKHGFKPSVTVGQLLRQRCSAANPFLWYMHVLALVIGVVGNLINVLIFNHRHMRSYVNSLFYWLAMCDFLELIIFGALSFLLQWEFTEVSLFPPVGYHAADAFQAPKFFDLYDGYAVFPFLLMSLHTMTILLNIALAFSRYLAIVKPLLYRIRFGRPSAKRTMIGVFALGCALSVPIFFCRTTTGKASRVIRRSEGFGAPKEVTDVIEVLPEPNALWAFLFSGLVVRVGLLIVLFAACVTLSCAVVRTRRERRQFLDSAGTGAVNAGVAVSQITQQITNVTLLIVLIFSISEILIVISSILGVVYVLDIEKLPSYGPDVGRSFAPYSVVDPLNCVNEIVPMTLLLSSGYSTFCFLLYSTQYRRILITSWRGGWDFSNRVLALRAYKWVPKNQNPIEQQQPL